MQSKRLVLGFFLCTLALACITVASADSDISIHLLGFHFERHTKTSSPLTLTIQSDAVGVSGKWSADVSEASREKYSYLGILLLNTNGNIQQQFGTMANDSGRFAFLFDGIKKWPGQATVVAPAGSIVFTGKPSGKKLSGQFVFSPDTNYLTQAAQHLEGKPSNLELFSLALQDVTLNDITQYAASGLKLRAGDVIRLKNSGIQWEFCRDIRKVRAFSIDDIIRLRNSGMDAAFPAELKKAGYDFDANDLVRLRNAGVSADFARDWKRAGFNYDAEALVRMRNSGVPAEMAKAVHEVFPNASGEQIVRLRNAGLSAEFITESKRADASLTADELIHLRNAGVPSDYLKAWRDAGYTYSADEIVHLRNAGVPADYAAATKVAERKPLSAETLIRLRNRGLTAQDIRELRQ